MKSIATALAAAQTQMGKAVKAADNPAFKRDGKVMKYADLSSVMDACLPALNAVGIAVIQPTGENEYGRHVETILIHGESGESLSCQVPLIVSKNDMQGYGSAVTYARRYGLMAMAGIAPEDDDGNAAAKAAPKQELPQPITADQFKEMNDLIFDTETDEAKFCAYWQVDDLHDMTLKQGKDAIAMLTKKKSKLAETGAGHGSAE